MRKIIIAGMLFLALTSFIPLNAQWARTYGGSDPDYAQCIQQTNDGGYIMAGSTQSFGAGWWCDDIWILKLNSAGAVQWQRTYGGSDYDSVYSIQQTSDGGYIVAGSTQSFGAGGYDIWVLKLNSSGTIEWQRTYGGSNFDFAYSIQQTSDGGYIVAAFTASFGAGWYDIWVLKLNSSGTIEWQRTYGGSDYDGASSIQQTSDGGYIVGGFTNSFGAGGYDILVLKLNSSGTIEWQRTYGCSDKESDSPIQQTSDGGYIVTGETQSFGAGGNDIWVLKLNSSGTIEWQRTYGGSDYDWPSSIQQTSDGGYIVTGSTQSFGAGWHDIWVLKLNSSGTIEWQRTYGGSDYDCYSSIQQTSDGGYIVGGSTQSFGAGGFDFLVLKLSPNGSIDQSCEDIGFIGSSNAIVSDTHISPSNTSVTPVNTNVTPQSTHISPQGTNVISNLICSGKKKGRNRR